MGRFFALNLAALMGLGLLSISSAQAQHAYGKVASDTGREVSIRAPSPRSRRGTRLQSEQSISGLRLIGREIRSSGGGRTP